MLPQRITPALCNMLKKYHPVWLNTHFNHPNEITPSPPRPVPCWPTPGIPLGNQSVLLAGINDCVFTMKKLVNELVKIRVRPYYIYQCDLSMGLEHFRTPVEVVEFTDVMTPPGAGWRCVRTLSDGYVQLAGAVGGQAAPPLTRRFQELGPPAGAHRRGRRAQESGGGRRGGGWPCCAPAPPWTGTWSWWWRRPPTPAGSLPANGRKTPPSAAALDGQEARFALFTPEGEPVGAAPGGERRPKWNKLPRRPLVLWAAGGISGTLCCEKPGPAGRPHHPGGGGRHPRAGPGRAALDLFLRNGGELRVRRGADHRSRGGQPLVGATAGILNRTNSFRALREVIDLPVVNVKEGD